MSILSDARIYTSSTFDDKTEVSIKFFVDNEKAKTLIRYLTDRDVKDHEKILFIAMEAEKEFIAEQKSEKSQSDQKQG